MNHGVVIGDQGFVMFRQMISYKGHLEKVNPKNTSKTCHTCGFVNPKVKVGINYWKCPVCGENHDRDINAALNILSKYVTSRGHSRLGTYRNYKCLWRTKVFCEAGKQTDIT